MNKAEPETLAPAAGAPTSATAEAFAVVRKAIAHDSAVKHVCGTAA